MAFRAGCFCVSLFVRFEDGGEVLFLGGAAGGGGEAIAALLADDRGHGRHPSPEASAPVITSQ